MLQFDHVAFQVRDAAGSATFYQEHFGFQKEMEMDNAAPHLPKIIFLRLGGMRLELIQPEAPPAISGCHVCLVSDSFAADYTRLVQAGVTVLQQPVAASGGRRRCTFLGSDGEEIEISG